MRWPEGSARGAGRGGVWGLGVCVRARGVPLTAAPPGGVVAAARGESSPHGLGIGGGTHLRGGEICRLGGCSVWVARSFHIYIFLYIIFCPPFPPSPPPPPPSRPPLPDPAGEMCGKRVNVRVQIAECGSGAKLLTQGYEAWLGRL